MELPKKSRKEIIEFLKSVPNLNKIDGRQAFIYSVGLDLQLQEQIHFDGSLVQFIELLVTTLLQYGRLDDGQHALESVLEAAKHYVGQDRQTYCDTLIQELRRYFEQQSLEIPEQKNIQNRNRIFVGILAFVVVLSISSIVILVWSKITDVTFFRSSQKEKVYYTVKLVLPSRMSGADIYVDGQPANILEQTHTVVTIQVEKKQENYQFIAKKTDERCTKTQLIQKNDETIFVCQ